MALALRTMVIPTNRSDSMYKVKCRALSLGARVTYINGAARKYKALSGDGGTDVMRFAVRGGPRQAGVAGTYSGSPHVRLGRTHLQSLLFLVLWEN